VATDVGLGGIDHRLTALAHVGHRVQRLLEFDGDLLASGL
jgi:hypothetical protein